MAAPSATPMLEIRDASKSYWVRNLKEVLLLRPRRRVPALDRVSLRLVPGQITALLGPNGAGKTTLINMICDLTRADTGSVTVAGFRVPKHGLEAQRRLGLVTTNDRSFFWRLTGRQNLEFFAALQGLPRRQARERSQELLDRFGLGDPADRLFHTYSAGMKKRLGIARALLHRPMLLLMDEPTNGLDAEATEDLLSLVKHEVGASGKSVLWATHRAEEVERLCDSVVVLNGGRVCFNGTVREFQRVARRGAGFTIEVRVAADQRETLRTLARSLGGELGALDSDGHALLTGIRDEAQLSELLRAILETSVPVTRVERLADPLHEIFETLKADQESS